MKKFQNFIDNHPRTGWYIAGVTTVNLVLQLAGIVVEAVK